MVLYKNKAWLTESARATFDKVYDPGDTPDHSGIFRCMGCGREVVGEMERKLPPQNHHQHKTSQGSVRWKLAAYCDASEK